MDTTVHTTLSALESKLAALLISITSTPTAAGAPAATLALLDADDGLSNALHTLRTHQTNYTRILKLRAEARGLEDRIRGIARGIGSIGDEISAARNEGDGSDSDDSDESENESDHESGDVQMTMDGENKQRQQQQQQIRPKEVDYKLLLDFARRISKYNVQAAADAATGADRGSVPRAEKVAAMDAQTQGETQPKDPGLAAVTQEATSWLDATANLTRDASLLPYPTEDRIRMGLMGQLQAAAVEKGGDIEKEVEQVLQPAGGSTIETVFRPGRPEGGAEDTAGPAPAGGPPAAGQTGTMGASGVNANRASGAEQTAKPKAKFDLDLYDPDDDDI